MAGHNFVYLGPEPWEGLWRNRHWLMSRFARDATVLYVEPPRTLRPTLAAWRAGQLSLTPWHWRALTHVQDHLHLYQPPPFAPVTGLPGLRRVTALLRRKLLARSARRLGLDHPILWISRPWVADLAAGFDPLLTIYHVVDEYSAYPGQTDAERERMRSAEQKLLRSADLVIVSSRKLLEAKRPANPNTFWVPNGVNVAGYERHLAGGAPVPAALAAVPRPRLGYLGQVSSKLDFDLLKTIAHARPQWNFVFVGELTGSAAQADWLALRALSNVYDLGPVPAAQVPQFVCGFDVGLMPYRQNEHSQFIDPLKLYDYLAAGLPIASVELPALAGYQALLHVGNGPAAFTHAIEAALRDRTPARAAERRAVAAQQSWEQRAAAIAALIEQRLGGAVANAAAAFGPELDPTHLPLASVNR